MMTLSCNPGTSTPSTLRPTARPAVESSFKNSVRSRSLRSLGRCGRLLPSEYPIHCPAGGQDPRTPRECGEVPGTRTIPGEWTRLDEEDRKLSEYASGYREAEVAKPSRKRPWSPLCPDDEHAR